jgi:DNA mismatch repair ATPase MutS
VDGAVEKPGQDLELLAAVLERFEREWFQAPPVARLRDTLRSGAIPPSVAVRRLSRLVALLDSRRNQLFAPFAYLLLWGTQLGFAVEAWRARHGAAVGRWIDAVGTLEALCSLAGHAFENPADPFPEILEGTRAHLEAEGLAHPLLPPATAVRNDVVVGTGNAIPQVLLVSGSNMSGKSTLLRAVGINAVLALAGAPVRARRLRLTALSLGATLRIQDSLQEGTSRFFAEVQRLSDLVKLARGERPLLFLLDEILHGTNSHDRRLGAEGIVRGLLARGAVGLVTTHDLALAAIAEELGPAAANVHFEDRLEGGKLTFDYTLRPGVVRRSNALELMRSVGLEV